MEADEDTGMTRDTLSGTPMFFMEYLSDTLQICPGGIIITQSGIEREFKDNKKMIGTIFMYNARQKRMLDVIAEDEHHRVPVGACHRSRPKTLR